MMKSTRDLTRNQTSSFNLLANANLNADETPKKVSDAGVQSDYNDNQIVIKGSVIRKNRKLTYIKEGDLGIVWRNAFVFGLGHLAYAYAIYVSIAHFSWKLQLWSKYIHTPISYLFQNIFVLGV